MHLRRTPLVSLAAIGALVTLTACGGGSGAPNDASFGDDIDGTTLSVWGFNNADDVGTARLEHAEQQLDGVTLELDNGNFDAQKFAALAASGGLPDAVQMDRSFVGTYAAQGLLMPLDDCFSEADVDPQERFYPHVVDDVTYDDQIWGVPQFYQPAAILLNTRVLEAEGFTAEDFDMSNPDRMLEVVEQLYVEGPDGSPERLGIDPQLPSNARIFMLAFGGSLVDADGVPTLDDPNNVEALEFMKQLMDAQGGYAEARSLIDSIDAFGDENQFVTDAVAAQIMEQWFVNVLAGTADDVEISATPLRTLEGDPLAIAGGQAFVIPAGAENPAAACQWMLSLTSTDAWMAAGEARAQTIADNEGVFTGIFTGSPEADQAIREAFVDPTGLEGFDETIATYYEVAEAGQSTGTSPVGQEIQVELQGAVTAALLGEKEPAQALADAQETAMRAYEQNTAT